MKIGSKRVVLVNDLVLIRLEPEEERTEAGLYLPQTAMDKTPVQTGRVVSVGPGIPVPVPGGDDDDEPWKENASDTGKYVPLQAEVGDSALFLRDKAIDVKVDGQEYLVVPHSGILMLLRNSEY